MFNRSSKIVQKLMGHPLDYNKDYNKTYPLEEFSSYNILSSTLIASYLITSHFKCCSEFNYAHFGVLK